MAGHGDDVAADELAGVGELDVEHVRRAAGEQQHDHDDDGEADRQQRCHARDAVHPPIGALAFPPQNSAVPTIPIRWIPMMFATIDWAVALPTPTGPPVT